MTKHAGQLSISRVESSDGGRYINIRLTDPTSHSEVVSLDIGMEHFGEAVTGRSLQPCMFRLSAEKVGKEYQQEIRVISIPTEYIARPKSHRDAIAAILKPHEVDGWVADYPFNRQISYEMSTQDGRSCKVKVRFYRYTISDSTE